MSSGNQSQIDGYGSKIEDKYYVGSKDSKLSDRRSSSRGESGRVARR